MKINVLAPPAFDMFVLIWQTLGSTGHINSEILLASVAAAVSYKE